MFYTIYKITDRKGREYIGKHQTTDLDDGYMGSGKRLKRAIEKHDAETFKKEILHVFDNEEEMNRKEAELVTEEYCARDDTYNICPGGKGGFGYLNNQYWTEDRRNEHRKKLKGNESCSIGGQKTWHIGYSKMREKCLELVKENHPKGFQGKFHSEETKKKVSEKMKKYRGEKSSQFGTMWITDGINNRKVKKDLPIPEGWYKDRTMK